MSIFSLRHMSFQSLCRTCVTIPYALTRKMHIKRGPSEESPLFHKMSILIFYVPVDVIRNRHSVLVRELNLERECIVLVCFGKLRSILGNL